MTYYDNLDMLGSDPVMGFKNNTFIEIANILACLLRANKSFVASPSQASGLMSQLLSFRVNCILPCNINTQLQHRAGTEVLLTDLPTIFTVMAKPLLRNQMWRANTHRFRIFS